MARPPARSRAERIADTQATLAREVDCWVASASADGDTALIPLSFVWSGGRIVLATGQSSVTVRNLERAGRARLALGTTRDVVLVDGTVEVVASADIDPALGEAFAKAADWEPRDEPAPYVYILVTPRRIQAWREANELAERTIMTDGAWAD
jgi:hypothetical protein